MAGITFDTGVVSFDLNGKTTISFNPTDSVIVEKIYNTFDELDRKQDAYKAEIERCGNKREIFDIARRRDQEMRAIIDDLFGKPICDELFGDMNIYALADGLPVWCNLMLAVIDQIDTAFSREQKATNPRVAKYTAKWKK